jgi:hypothetical protein
LKLAIYGNVGILVETGIAFETRFRCSTVSDDSEIVLEKTDTPLDAYRGIVMLKSMGLALGYFDEFAVGDTGIGPMGREMIGIELKETVAQAGHTTNDNMFAAFATFFEIIHGSPEEIDIGNGSEIAHASGRRSGNSGRRNVGGDDALQTAHNDIFQMPRHVL